MPDAVTLRGSSRSIAPAVIAAPGYLVWRGCQHPEFMLELGNLRYG